MREVKDARHQGYANYETFTVSTALNNERDIYEHFKARAQELKEEYPAEVSNEDEAVYSGVCIRLADEVKEWMEDRQPVIDTYGPNQVFDTLLNAAIDTVDWREVAEDFLTE